MYSAKTCSTYPGLYVFNSAYLQIRSLALSQLKMQTAMCVLESWSTF